MLERLSAVVYDPGAYLEALGEIADASQLVLTKAASAQDLIEAMSEEKPDVVLLDYEMQNSAGANLTRRLREVDPAIPILFVSEKPDWAALERHPLTDMVKSPVDPNEALHRILKLVMGSRNETPIPSRIPGIMVERLRSENGRIDAKLVADLFEMSIPALAKLIGAGEPALYKTPDAKSVQNKLSDFEKVAWGLLRLTGSEKGLRMWLNTPNADLDKALPIDYIKEGYLVDVAAMVEDALLGHPS